ncbi:copper amine oxidase N-terminal domain-containing protein [Bacillus horti]|uniref:PKD repeat protein n=1 Tax=Caldalkalibacillus horti TaxID=77523 RepID=A0ABT9VVE8_9BACI|nr:copper amine oxidase N-terminal domain-containing protein [Bacillus horti]MDQ0164958.1 PKD repeat protein [Bacillus horti]
MKWLVKKNFIVKVLSIILIIQVLPIKSLEDIEASSSIHTLVLRQNSTTFTHNGQALKAVQPVTLKNGVTYAPLSSLAKVYQFNISFDPNTKESIVKNDALEIRFKANTSTIRVNGRTVQSSGELFTQQGYLMVPVRTWAELTRSTFAVTKDSITFKWKDSYLAPNTAPIAAFKTDKQEYRLGEPIRYTDQSYDDEDQIVRRTWKGNEPAFFKPGDYTIHLEVEDRHGLKNSVRHTITVTDVQLHSEEEFYRLFTPVGDKFPIAGPSVLEFEPIAYTVHPENVTFVRSNSPEHLNGEEGIAYQDTLSGLIRFNTHNQNLANQNMRIHLIATNPHRTSALVDIRAFGQGGPTTFVSTSGKTAVSRYLTSWMNSRKHSTIRIQAGQSKIIVPEVNESLLRSGLTMTTYTDVYTNKELTFSIVVTAADTDPIEVLSELKSLKRDGKHIRGTFHGANRTLEVVEVESVGYAPQRLVIGDTEFDEIVQGVDRITGSRELNRGNQGILYTTKLQVAPHTLVALNARGGHYAGAFLVNGQVVHATDTSILRNQHEAGVLYRTGFYEETVELSFVLASGSNLPLHVLFLPVYEKQMDEEPVNEEL